MATWPERKAAAFQQQRELEAREREARNQPKRWPLLEARQQSLPETYYDGQGQKWRKLPNSSAYVRDGTASSFAGGSQGGDYTKEWWVSVPTFKEAWEQHQRQRSSTVTSTAAPLPTPVAGVIPVDLEPDAVPALNLNRRATTERTMTSDSLLLFLVFGFWFLILILCYTSRVSYLELTAGRSRSRSLFIRFPSIVLLLARGSWMG